MNEEFLLNENASEFYAEEATTYELAPEGTHLARAVGLVNLGTQKQEFQGKPGKDRKKIMITWELPEELRVFSDDNGEQPFLVSNIYSLVVSDKSTYKLHMESWTKGRIDTRFNPASMIGKPCLINITHKPSVNDPTKMKAKVTSVSPLMKNQVCPDRISPIKILSFGNWDEDLFNEQSEWVKKQIEASPEYRNLKKDSPYNEGNREGAWQKNGKTTEEEF